jgi:hypothetical protein
MDRIVGGGGKTGDERVQSAKSGQSMLVSKHPKAVTGAGANTGLRQCTFLILEIGGVLLVAQRAVGARSISAMAARTRPQSVVVGTVRRFMSLMHR